MLKPWRGMPVRPTSHSPPTAKPPAQHPTRPTAQPAAQPAAQPTAHPLIYYIYNICSKSIINIDI